MAAKEPKIKFVSNAEQHARGGPRTFYPKLNWPYFGDYNPRVHGTYDPAVKYGPQKPSVWEWKVGELFKNLEAADKSAYNMMNTASRWIFRIEKRHFRCMKQSVRPMLIPIAVMTCIHQVLKLGIWPDCNGGQIYNQAWKYHW
ncbi:uncharacterized protein LOC127866443 [Dreissena polymorpha]|uniref:Uncharacterized protein n=1 Tax=Dreissena polymorpha TaxID=45954 RepID=A0A9D4LSK1_DREPO|nr:uncharacterized protein LOC127866443 [Dreissena polymorpha]KAH3863109.1 hypothetical protein DPMN_026087 [Dreissena polymorpha]